MAWPERKTITLCRLRIVGMMIECGRVESGDEGTRVSVWWGQELGDRRKGRETNECRDGLAGLALHIGDRDAVPDRVVLSAHAAQRH